MPIDKHHHFASEVWAEVWAVNFITINWLFLPIAGGHPIRHYFNGLRHQNRCPSRVA